MKKQNIDTPSQDVIRATRALMAQYKELHAEINFSHSNKNLKDEDIQKMWDYINCGLRTLGLLK